MNYYVVTFDTKKGGDHSWIIHIKGKTLKDARQNTEELWYKDNSAHMFHIKVRRLKDDEEFKYNYFKKVEG